MNTFPTFLKKRHNMKFQSHPVRSLQALALGLAICSAHGAQTFNLHADKLTKSLPGGVSVEMWGFGLESAAATSPGPTLTVNPGESEITIFLTNNLSVPISLIIPGQNGFVRDGSHSTFTDTQNRVRGSSFAKETQPGQTGEYKWTNVKPGTFLYHSASHAALQVQMGLYGALKQDASPGEAYAAVSYANDVILLLSEIDLDVHEAVRTNTYGTSIKSMIHSVPEYFLVNGEPFTAAQAPLPGGINGETTLFRFLNACFDTRHPVLNGQYLKVVAEDGQPYAHPRDQIAINLPALKTIDALWVAEASGNLVVYDRRLNLANRSQPDGGLYQRMTVAP